MIHKIFPVVLALCLCISSQSMALSWQETFSAGDVVTEELTSGLNARDSVVPTPTEVYESMIALKEQDAYKEGTTWTNDEPYSDTTGCYYWEGGPLGGANIAAVGCVAFAFVLSDAAFGSLPARMYAAGEFTFEDIKVGDILRVSNDVHTVIVLEVSDVGVVIAEGNNGTGDHVGKVHWGRAISKEEVMSNTSHYITRYPEGYVAPDDPTANDIIDEGTLDGGLTWSLTKAGTLAISGNGAMPDFNSTGDQPWSGNSSEIRKVVIGNGVTSIGACAFWNCGVLSAEISPSVTAIGNSAFRGTSMISVTIPSSVKTIGDSAFRECQNLSSITVSEGVETIEQNAFRSCVSLTSIALPASIGEVGAGAFFQCTGMTGATFAPGSKQVELGDNLFTECYYLMTVTLPQSIDRIGEGMFQNCLMLAGVEIPQGAASIGASAFASSGVSVVIIPDSVETIGIAAFSNCPLTDIYFTGTETQWNSVSKIGDTASAVSTAIIHYEYSPEPAPNPEPTAEPAPEPTAAPAPEPTAAPAPEPTAAPVPEPTAVPVPGPTAAPVPGPTAAPAPGPTTAPAPTMAPQESTTVPAPTTAPQESTTASAPATEPTTAPAQTYTPDTLVPYIDNENGKEGWEVIKEEAAKASEGERISVNMNGASVVPGDVLDSVKGQDITITFDLGDGLIWSVNGQNVTADSVNDVDLSAQVGTSDIPQDIVNTVAGDRQAIQLSLAHSGDFGYTAVLLINVGSANSGLYANLFYYNDSADGLEFVTADQINEDGIAELAFTHASDYAIVIGGDVLDESSGEVSPESDSGSLQETEDSSSETDDSGSVTSSSNAVDSQQEGNSLIIVWLILIVVIGIAGIGVIIYLNKKKKNQETE